ncbi:MAG TPA: patatin-like phospholipase family protein, partial [Tepidisphaeraceae bacterium]|nr:patatin-like phospholipase family protein [Tepidisphaeraceae bacterium]
IVSGVSTGALIAPFAFIGDDEAYEAINQLYRNPEKDWVKSRWPLAFLPNHVSLAEVPGLEREMKRVFTLEMAQEVVQRASDDRMLVVNTTNLDDASPRVFELVGEAERAVETKDLSRLHNILLASAGIPGAFPYREIDGEMYVDGGVTSNIIYGGNIGEEDSLPAVWQRLYPDTPIPKIRYWIIINNQFYAPPTVTPARWSSILMRSVSMSIRSSNLIALRHLFAMAEISRLKRNADIEVRVVSIPDDWVPLKEGTFVKETMNDLADLGERMGADVNSWKSDQPGP